MFKCRIHCCRIQFQNLPLKQKQLSFFIKTSFPFIFNFLFVKQQNIQVRMQGESYIVYKDAQKGMNLSIESKLKTNSFKYFQLSKYFESTKQLNQVLSLIDRWGLKSIQFCIFLPHVDDAKNQLLLVYLQHIKFQNLTSINIRHNSIQSIENLNRIFIPFLSHLYLSNNKINKAEILRKGFWLQLSYLTLQNNKILQIESLAEIPTDKLGSILLESFAQNRQNCDIRFSVKLRSKVLTNLCKVSHNKVIKSNIKEERTNEVLKKKYENIQIVNK